MYINSFEKFRNVIRSSSVRFLKRLYCSKYISVLDLKVMIFVELPKKVNTFQHYFPCYNLITFLVAHRLLKCSENHHSRADCDLHVEWIEMECTCLRPARRTKKSGLPLKESLEVGVSATKPQVWAVVMQVLRHSRVSPRRSHLRRILNEVLRPSPPLLGSCDPQLLGSWVRSPPVKSQLMTGSKKAAIFGSALVWVGMWMWMRTWM